MHVHKYAPYMEVSRTMQLIIDWSLVHFHVDRPRIHGSWVSAPRLSESVQLNIVVDIYINTRKGY